MNESPVPGCAASARPDTNGTPRWAAATASATAWPSTGSARQFRQVTENGRANEFGPVRKRVQWLA
jgi:hypothetical protein